MVVTSTAVPGGGEILEHEKFNRAIVATAAFRMTWRFMARQRGMVLLSLHRSYIVRHSCWRNHGRGQEQVMTFPREPRIHPVSIATLRPTQITVGMREVKAKRKSWRDPPDRKKADFLGRHLIPVVWGPKDEYYVIDHHHLTLALHQEGVKNIATTVVADLRRLPRDAFWVYLDNRGWLHPFDERGRRRS